MDNGGVAHVTWKLKERWQLKTRELGDVASHGLRTSVHNMQGEAGLDSNLTTTMFV